VSTGLHLDENVQTDTHTHMQTDIVVSTSVSHCYG